MEDIILKKINMVKQHINAPRMVYTKSIKQLEYLKEHLNINCSRSTFVKYRTFYIEVPLEREKAMLFVIVCQNAHTKLRGINTS